MTSKLQILKLENFRTSNFKTLKPVIQVCKQIKQAGAELCQAQGQFGLAWFGSHCLICLHT